MKKLGAQIVFATFLVMLSTAVLTVTVILLLQFLGALPQVKYPAIVWPVIALAICVAVGTGINALLTRWYFRPMKQLIEATRRVAKRT
jgi:ABC-type transport system involved in cytochrome bd biosynthesis fused ATPase/permease subunit